VQPRSKLAWETGDVEAILDTEFRRQGATELGMSVYHVVVDQSSPPGVEVVQVHVEHSASFFSPPREETTIDYDVSDASPAPFAIDATPGETMFRFANERHRDFVFASEVHLIKFLTSAATAAERRVEIPSDQLQDYIVARVDGGDPEWAMNRRDDPEQRIKKWDKKCRASINARVKAIN